MVAEKIGLGLFVWKMRVTDERVGLIEHIMQLVLV
jgi:hypothetical protein